ncbi:MAG: hypothetical protein RJQ10_11975 [Haliea sp.]|uniref:hypothetical protein n=1 Tax=Haliea sp. TaxID=1932666 RepID=UPI0032ECD1CE
MTSKRLACLGLTAPLLLITACSDGGGSRLFEPPPPPPPDTFIEVRANAASDYARVDRTGQPAVATALLRPGGQPIRDGVPINGGATNERDSLNQGDPENDGEFAGAFVGTLIVLNNALADDLDSLGLARCSTGAPGSINSASQIASCIDVAAPVVIPDVITLNISQPGGWPNGRHPDDPVVDRLLAAALLDLSPGSGQGLDLFAGLPLNPPGNDARADDPSPPNFPYLRDPIEMP